MKIEYHQKLAEFYESHIFKIYQQTGSLAAGLDSQLGISNQILAKKVRKCKMVNRNDIDDSRHFGNKMPIIFEQISQKFKKSEDDFDSGLIGNNSNVR